MQYAELARAESALGELVLREHRQHRDAAGRAVLELRANGAFVMDTAETGTERALAAAALARVEHPRDVVVGGLGLGFTAREVLADPRVARCTVVEIEAALVDWLRTGTVPHGPALLAEDRLRVVVADVAAVLAAAGPAAYDLVLLDVDNGPGHLVHEANAALYRTTFLACVAHTLRPGGVLVVWSADRSPALVAALREAFGNAEQIPLDVELQGREEEYVLHLARQTG